MSTAGGRSPGAALLALVSTQVSPIRQRLLAEAGVQRAKRGTDLLRNSWPLVRRWQVGWAEAGEPFVPVRANRARTISMNVHTLFFYTYMN
jgi:hypothetical protein